MLAIEGLTKSYAEGDGRRTVLDRLDLEAGAGEVVVVTGPSGSGKSTLLNLVAGLDAADAGRVRFDGVDLLAMDDRSRTLFRRRHIGFVFQFFNLLPTLTVAENLALPLELNAVARPRRRTAVEAMLERIGLAGRGARAPDTLSGGEQQRVAVGRALIHEPRLLLADEPTGNLDAGNASRVLDLLATLGAGPGRLALMVTHSAEAAAAGSRRAVLDGGRLVTPDPP